MNPPKFSNTFTGKNLHISGPAEFKPVSLKGQVYMQISNHHTVYLKLICQLYLNFLNSQEISKIFSPCSLFLKKLLVDELYLDELINRKTQNPGNRRPSTGEREGVLSGCGKRQAQKATRPVKRRTEGSRKRVAKQNTCPIDLLICWPY